MSVSEIALKALKCFEKSEYFVGLSENRKREYLAAVGYLQGVSEGKITTGQNWFAEIMMGSQLRNDDDCIPYNTLSEEETDVLKEVFASGMCCQGQQLDGKKGKEYIRRA